MKRIAGIINLDQMQVNSIVIDQMLGAMKLHPSNVQSTCIHEELGLGWTSISDVPDHDQPPPLLDPLNRSLVITFDGRIDNRRELQGILTSQLPERGASIFDEEILLAAYQKWGSDCPKYLVGDFAFAIWDKVNRYLFCARDHFGVRPFYYCISKTAFVFASTPQGALASLRVPYSIDDERISDVLMEFAGGGLEAADKTSTLYKNVFRLPPAHMLIVSPTGISLERYWELSPAYQTEYKKEDEYLELFEDLFCSAVRCRVGDATMSASMLSGGIDSAAIVGMGCNILKEEGKLLHTFTAIPNSVGPNREYQHIFSVINQGNLLPHLISNTDLLLQMDKLVEAIKEENDPFDCLMNLNRAIYLDAKKQGVNIMLDGVDGDLLLSRSFYITPLWQQGAFRTILNETLMANGFTAEYKLGGSYILDSFLSVFTPYTPRFIRRIYRQRRYQSKVTSLIEDSIIDHEFASETKLYDRIVQLHSYQKLDASRSQVEAHRKDLDHPNFTAGLERYERVASAYGIQASHPFADVRLAEFSLSLPWQLKTRQGWTKYILRKTMEPYLPDNVIWRRDKDNLMWEVSRLILKERAEYFHQATMDEKKSLNPYVDVQKLERIWQEYLIKSDETHAELIWSGIALAFWLRRHRNMVRDLKL